jgi:4-amino-4-deoxy-L-arabinose transferase-like glycosyltransferase
MTIFCMTKPPLASILTLVLLALSGTFLILYATPQGMGLSDDSIAYIAGARSILSGQGYREAWLASNQPVTHFPPGFSTVLALIGFSGLDPLRGTRFVNSLLFGANIFLLGIIGWRMTKSKIAGILLAILLLLNGQLFRVHTTAMSEPLFIFFTLAAFLSFWKYMSPSPFGRGVRGEGFLLLTAILTAFTYLTRYAGLALLATLLVSLFILHPTWKKRLTSAGIFLAGFIPFALAWSTRNRLLTDNATNRQLVYHPITAENIQLGISNFAAFILPIEEWRRTLIKVPNLFVIILIALVSTMLVWILYKGSMKFFKPAAEAPEVLSFIGTLYIFAYLASIISSMTLFDASTKFHLRILAPVYVSLLIILVYFGYWIWQKSTTTSRFTFYALRIAFFTLTLFAFTTSIYAFTSTLTQLRKGGQGYASFQWFDSEAMDFLSQLPEGTRIYSNQVGPVYLYTGRPGYVLPDVIDPVTGLPRGNTDEGIALLQADVLTGEAALALFDFGSQDDDVQLVYRSLSEGLCLAFDKQGDKIYTAYP